MQARQFKDFSKLKIEKIPTNDQNFFWKIFDCINVAKTNESRWRLYCLSLLLNNYNWIEYTNTLSR